MGLPAMNIVFVSAARDAVRRSDRGSVGMIIKDAAIPEGNPAIVYKEKDIPSTLSEENQNQIKLALMGYEKRPSKIVVYVLPTETKDYSNALAYFAIKKVAWLCCPTVKTDNQTDAVATWVKEQRENKNKIKSVLPETDADCEGIVNFATESIPVGAKTYTSEQYCSRIAGLLAGTPMTMGATFAVLNEVSAINTNKEIIDKAIDAGKFMLFYDGEKVKVARAVNSLTTVKTTQSQPWKKIKVVETMDMINDDLTLLTEDNYIGKYTNTYSNKCLLLTAIRAYLQELQRVGVIEDYDIDFDVDSIRDYIVLHKGVTRDAAEEMKDEEVKRQYTDEKVFFAGKVTIADVMEDINLNIAI